VTAFRPISEAAHSWSSDNTFYITLTTVVAEVAHWCNFFSWGAGQTCEQEVAGSSSGQDNIDTKQYNLALANPR